jgi:hypothetical protein
MALASSSPARSAQFSASAAPETVSADNDNAVASIDNRVTDADTGLRAFGKSLQRTPRHGIGAFANAPTSERHHSLRR